MKKEVIVWLVIFACAVAIRLSGLPRGFDLAWRVDPNTHRGVAVSVVLFWVLLTALGGWILWDVLCRLRAR
jgi:hypothetical protein